MYSHIKIFQFFSAISQFFNQLVYSPAGVTTTVAPTINVPTEPVFSSQRCGMFPSQYLAENATINFSTIGLLNSTNFGPKLTKANRVDLNSNRSQTSHLEFPWQAALFLQMRGFVCSASVILSRWIVSTASCVELERDVNKWSARFGFSELGSFEINSGEEIRKILAILRNRNYSRSSFFYDYDVALLQLDQDLIYSSFIQPICIPPQAYQFYGMSCYVSGGRITGDTFHENQFEYDRVDVIENEVCNRQDYLDNLVTERMTCAGKGVDSRSSCVGDTGSPLACYVEEERNWMLAGISSWGIECGLPKFPGVYTSLSYFSDWLWNAIAQAEGVSTKGFSETFPPVLEGSGSGSGVYEYA